MRDLAGGEKEQIQEQMLFEDLLYACSGLESGGGGGFCRQAALRVLGERQVCHRTYTEGCTRWGEHPVEREPEASTVAVAWMGGACAKASWGRGVEEEHVSFKMLTTNRNSRVCVILLGIS